MSYYAQFATRCSLMAGVALMPFCMTGPAEAVGFDRGAPSVRQDVVLAGIASTTAELARRGIQPVNVFDLDSTLFDVGGRHKAIMREYARSVRERHPGMEPKIDAWVTDELPYEVSETFPSLGITAPEEVREAKAFWKKRFFSNEYLRYDLPIAGAVRYVRALRGSGSVVVYLTGRQGEPMREGTRHTLERAGFPLDARGTVLIMNDNTGLHDAEFKGGSAVHAQITRLGTAVAIFDNEPQNVNLLQRSFPGALTVFLDTNHTPAAPPVEPGIPWIRNFRRSWLWTRAELESSDRHEQQAAK